MPAVPLRHDCWVGARTDLNAVQAVAPECASIVIDTNIVLDLLVFDDPVWAALQAALDTGQLRWIATPSMRVELERVLGYPLIARRLMRDARLPDAVLERFDAQVQMVDAIPVRAVFVCKDPDDQVFIDLAVAHKARLLSKDKLVLAMRKRLATLGVVVSPVFTD
ncbi:putative toxin-antitoxin system toxin component, PIN family [Variovorax sp. RHLX14]|uniref:putative toxin-antitoxin system toxin component, PIN family n=1 Tax=Variovorax sp. RHLX14 TaxID=1259731 RepID=UPI003F44857C